MKEVSLDKRKIILNKRMEMQERMKEWNEGNAGRKNISGRNNCTDNMKIFTVETTKAYQL